MSSQQQEARPVVYGAIAVMALAALYFAFAAASSRASEAALECTGRGVAGTVATSTTSSLRTLFLYVDGVNGNDGNDGRSPQSPFRTIQKAANSVAPGDTVTVLPGTYNERVSISRSGSDQAPVIFQAQGDVSTLGFNVRADFVTIRGFSIEPTGSDWNSGWGILIEASHCLIENNYVHFAIQGGIAIHASPGNDAGVSFNTIRNNRLYRNAQVGIDLDGINNIVEGNEVWGTIQYHPNLSNPPSWADADGIRFFGSGHLIRDNYIHDISYRDPENVNPHIDCFQTWADDHHSPATNVTIERNVCINLESQDTHETGHGFMLEQSTGIVLRNNLVVASGIVETPSQDNSYLSVLNNTFVSDLSFPYTGGINLDSCPNSTVQNNIFYNFPSNWIGAVRVIGTSSYGLTIGHNLYYRTDGGFLRAPVGEGDVRGKDPLFVDAAAGNYRLQPASPAVDAAADLSHLLNADMDGITRPQGAGFDIGAYEVTGR